MLSRCVNVRLLAILELVVKRILTFPDPSLFSSGIDVGALGGVVSSSDARLRDNEFSPEADDA